MWNVGNNGYSWSSSVSGVNGVDLNFNAANLNPSNADRRAYGFQVRCLQAFIGILFYYPALPVQSIRGGPPKSPIQAVEKPDAGR